MPSRPAAAVRAAPVSHQESHAVVEQLGAALASAGFPPMPSRVFSALLVDDDGRMTAAEVTEELSVSPAAVSGAVRYLAHVGLIRRERERGSRREVFIVQDDAFHGALTNTDHVYSLLGRALGDAIDHIGADSSAGQRMQLSREFLEFVTAEMGGMVDRWEAYKASRGGSTSQ